MPHHPVSVRSKGRISVKLIQIKTKKDAERLIDQLLKSGTSPEDYCGNIHGFYGFKNKFERGYWTIKTWKKKLYYSWKENSIYDEGLEIDRKDAINHLWSKRKDYHAWLKELKPRQ